MAKNRFFIILLLGFFPGGCSDRPPQRILEKYTESRRFMDQIVKVDVCHEKERRAQVERAVEKLWHRLEEISAHADVHDENSDLVRLNRAFPDPVEVDNDTYHLIKSALEYSRITNDAFDVTVLPLLRLWNDSEKKNKAPTLADIQRVQRSMGSNMIALGTDGRVRLKDARTQLDLSRLIDGFAADEAARILRAFGFTDFLVDTSGELYASGNNCEGTNWRIGIRDPRNSKMIREVVEIQNRAIAAAGDYEKYFTIGGVRWSQILDPKTGTPHREIASASVIGPNAESAEALATALCVMDPKEGTALIDALGKGWASFIYVRGKEKKLDVYISRNYERFRRKLHSQ